MESPTFELENKGKEGTFLIIRCKLPAKKTDAETSGSGKSLIYASTSGNMKTGLKINGDELVVGMNAYTKIPAKS